MARDPAPPAPPGMRVINRWFGPGETKNQPPTAEQSQRMGGGTRVPLPGSTEAMKLQQLQEAAAEHSQRPAAARKPLPGSTEEMKLKQMQEAERRAALMELDPGGMAAIARNAGLDSLNFGSFVERLAALDNLASTGTTRPAAMRR